MKKYLFGLVFIFAIAGCKKEIAPAPAPANEVAQTDDVVTFLNLSNSMFEGKINNVFFTKISGGYGYFDDMGWYNGDTDGICYPQDLHRCVVSGLTAQGGGGGSFELYSPRFNSASATDWSQIFSIGSKKLGTKVKDFYLSMNLGSDVYYTTATNTTNNIEILKTELFTDASGPKLRVWFTLNAVLVSSANTSLTANLSDGMMIGVFEGFSNQQ
jgi:hypothetical protein